MRVEVIGAARLYLGRMEDVIGDVRADLVLTDPPYGNSTRTANVSSRRHIRPYASAWRKPRHLVGANEWHPVAGDAEPFDPSPLLDFPSIVLWGANSFADRLPPSACWFAWDRKDSRAADSDITDAELAWVRGLPFKTVRLFRHMWAGFQRDSETGERHLHPTQKPVALMEWCLSFFPDARTVFDPYAGSGPVGVACVRTGREYIGVECDLAHYETLLRRIEAACRQADLFIPAPAPTIARQADMLEGM